jgi:hypothetical protein
VNDSQASTDSDLDWLAFQYVAGELLADESEAFELRLADDPSACEAVARAVQLLGTVAAAHSTAPTPVPQTSTVGLRWRRLAAVACVAALVVLGISLRLLQKPSAIDEVGLSERSNARTVSDWVALGSSENDSDESDTDDLELSFNDTEQPPKVDSPADDLAVPSWMVAALERDHDDRVEEE